MRVARQRLTEGLTLSWRCQESRRAGRCVCRLFGNLLFASARLLFEAPRVLLSAKFGPSTGPVLLGTAFPRACRETSPRHSTTRHQGTAVYFIRTVVYTLPAVARWPTPVRGNKAEVFDEILNEASVVPWQGHAKGRRALARLCRRQPSTRRRLPRTTVQVARQRLAEELRLSWLC